MSWRSPLVAVLALAWALGSSSPAAAQTEVDLALVLAVDVSGSVNEDRFELQRQGYADAFRNPRVLQAIRAGTRRRIAVAMMQWTGPALHVVVIDWTLVQDQDSAGALADQIQAAPRALYGGGTSVSGAIDFSAEMLGESPYRGERRTIDISGDGANNRGRPADVARDEAVTGGIVINGLPILTLEPDLDVYYRENVIGGPGAFVIAVSSYEAFAEAIVNKLVTEIAQR
jgi:hypothetical protein